MGLIADIFGGSKAVEKAFDLIDDAWETDSEKRESVTNSKIALMTAYHPFKKAQRLLALMFCTTYLACFLLMMASTIFGLELDLTAIEGVIQEFYIGEIAMIIITFYFGGGLVEGAIGKWKNGNKQAGS